MIKWKDNVDKNVQILGVEDPCKMAGNREENVKNIVER